MHCLLYQPRSGGVGLDLGGQGIVDRVCVKFYRLTDTSDGGYIDSYPLEIVFINSALFLCFMLCPYCGFDESNVLESRDARDGKATRRRRECIKCQKRFTTYETVANVELKVIKKDGRVEDYQREKLERCFEKACWKLSEEDRGKLIDEIEMKLLNWKSVEIPSREIGLMVMEKLKGVDPVAYIRFATVYQNISSVDEFADLIKNFKKTKK